MVLCDYELEEMDATPKAVPETLGFVGRGRTKKRDEFWRVVGVVWRAVMREKPYGRRIIR